MNTTRDYNLAGLAGLACAEGTRGPAGCDCSHCPKFATCTKPKVRTGPAMGFTISPPELPAVDFTDWKTWIIAALAALLVYQLFFRKEQRSHRTARREAFKSERARYQAAMRKIRES